MNRILSLVLSIMMVVSMLPASALSVFAAEGDVATVTDGITTLSASDADTLNQAVTAILETGSRTFTVELPADAEAGMITAIRRAICDTEGVADGSIHLTLKGVTTIPGTTNWDGVAFGPGDIYDEAGKIVDQELVTQLASINLPDVTEIGAQAFYFCENLVSVSAPKAQTIGAQAFGYTALTSVEFPELTTIPTDMFSGTWTLSSAKFPKVTTIEKGGLLVGAKFTPENNPTPFPLELTAEGNITFNGSNHFNIASQNYSGKVDLVLCCDKKDAVTFNEDGTATWQVRNDLSYTFKSITFKHSYVNGKCTACGEDCTHTGGTATCITLAVCDTCGVSYGAVDTTNHDSSVECENGFCPNGCYEPAILNAAGYYEIDNAGKLFWFAQQVNVKGNREIKGVLTANIDLENKPWTPIGVTGEENNNFRGVFDGQNYTIKGLYVEGSENGVGFFGEVRTGTVKNFRIYGNVVVNTEVNYVGGVIGSICGVNSTDHGLERNGAIIQNITSFVNVTAKAHGIGMIGGFVGYANHQSLIEQCAWYGTFDAGEYRVDSGAGGFIGKIQENTSEVTIRNCGAYGTIKTNYTGDYNNTATIYMGGFLSFSNTNAQTTLENCLFAGRFERGENLTDQAFLGAFGTLRSVNAIKNCYYLGDDGLEAVHSDSNLKPGSDNVEITSVTGEELRSNTIATQLGDHWMQDVHYPIPKDTKTHSDSATYTYTDNGDGTHKKTCNECGYVEVYNEAHSGGTATCTEQAECQHCGASYGEVGGHSPDAAGYTVNADGTHSYTCSSCGNPFTERHTFTDGACTGCGVIGGYCGEEGNEQNVIWTYANGTLTISGTGAMADQFDNYNNRPWEEYVDQITTIVVNDGITSIGEAAFWRFQKLTTAMLPDSLTTISQQAFYGCTALKTVNFPANLKTIEGWAFLGCALESVTLPEGLTTIGYRAFSECKNLTSVTVPASVTTIDEGAFGYSPAKITVAEDNLNYSSDEHGVLFDKDKTTLIYCRPNIEVETYTIPSTVTEICKEAFYGCKNLATITIPDGVQKIGSSAFGSCEALTTITIPAGVTTIEANTFYDCTALTAVTIPAGVTTIDMWAFSGCTALTTVTIPASVTSIAYNAFSNCSALTTVNVPCTWDGSLYTFDESVLNKVHNWVGGACTVCGVPCDHKDSTHTTATNNGDGTHSFECSVCVNTVIEDHTGGTATCTEQAECQHCGASYGELADHSTSYSADGMTITYKCATCDTQTVTFTLVIPTGAVYGGALEVPHYDSSDKTYQGDYPEITLDGALLKEFVPGAKTYEVVMTWGGKTVSGEYTIAKADVGITAPTPNTLTYTGEAQYLISAGEAVGGTMVYSLTEDGEYTTSIPQGTNAGDYKVWYYVQGDANHKDSAKDSVAVTIEKATVTVTADAKSKPYGDADPTLTYTSEGLLGDDVLTGALTREEGENAGSYAITLGTLTAGDNYTISFTGAELTITDGTAPTGTILIKENGWNKFWNTITFGIFCKDYVDVTVTADGTGSGVTKVEYLLSDTVLEENNIPVDGWTTLNADNGKYSFSIKPQNKVAVYVRITDEGGNVTVINSDGIVVYEDSKAVDTEVTYTYKENSNKDIAVEFNGNTVKSIVCSEKVLAAKSDYTVDYESGKIVLTASYLDTLNAGDYTFTVSYNPMGVENSGVTDLTTTFIVKVKPTSIDGAAVNVSGTFTYDGNAKTPDPMVVLNGETLVKDRDYTVSYAENVNAGTATVTVTGKGNYSGTKTATFSIAPMELDETNTVVKLDQNTFVYDGTEHKPAVTVTFNGVMLTEGVDYRVFYSIPMKVANGKVEKWFSDHTTSVECVNVGDNYYAVVVGLGNFRTKDAFTLYANFVIEKATVIEPTIATKPYTGSEQTADITDTELYTVVKNDGGTGVKLNGCYDVVLELKDSANYKWSTTDNPQVTLQFKITRAENEWTVDPSISGWTYGEAANTPVGTAKFGDVSVEYSGTTNAGAAYNSTTAPTEAGNYKATFIVQGTEDYKGLETSVDFTIAKKAVTVTANDASKTYGESDPALTYTHTELVGQDALDITVSRASGENANTYNITASQAEGANPNYEITFKNGTFTIHKAPLTITAEDKTATYGDAVPNYTVKYEGFVSGDDKDDLGGALAFDCGYTQFSDKGEYAIKASGYTSGNYTISYVDGKLTVNSKPITVTIQNATSVYGDTLAELKATDNGIVNGDINVYSLATTATGTSNVGKYAITGTALDGNYDVTFANGEYEITKREITITIDAKNTVVNTTLPTYTYKVEGLVGVDTLVTEPTLTCNANIALIGEYDITASGADAGGNYSIKYVPAKLTILTDNAVDAAAGYTEELKDYDPATVTSEDKAELEEMLSEINTILADETTTDNGKKALEEVKEQVEKLIKEITDAAEATDTENTEKVENVTPENVTPENKTDLEGAKADLEKALEDNGGNYTEDEKKAIEEEIKRIDDALEVIGNVEAVEEVISKLPAVDTVKPDDEEAIKAITDAQTAYNALSDYEKSLVDEATKAALDKLAAALVAYDIVEGDGSSWTEDSDHNITFVVNGLFSKFVGIKVDGKDVDKANYEVKAGSTIITLKASYLDTLAVGEHTISVVYTDGSTDGTFNVHAKVNSPATGDNSNMFLWIALLFISGGAVITLTVVERKKRMATLCNNPITPCMEWRLLLYGGSI